uniref:Meiosis-specific nuclear structural protein 1 n=1 Tax=Anopheles farauti TaxID=69004 RepID=A0A182Q068_9DIPT
MKHSARERQLKQNELCRAVEGNRLNANYQKDFDQIQRNCLEQSRKKRYQQECRVQQQEQEQHAQRQEADRRQRLIEEQERTRQLHEVNRLRTNEEKLRQQLRESNQEMRELESKLRAAYVAKGIAAQLAEAELRRKADRLQALKEMEEFERLKQENVEFMKSKQKAEEDEKRTLRSVLQQQMHETRNAKKCLYEEFLLEKQYLDAVVKKIQEEHLEAIRCKLERQSCTRQEMEYFQEAKQTWQARQTLLDEEENERIRKYAQEKDLMQKLERERKEESDRKRDHVNQEMVTSLEQEQREQRNREEMLQELYIAEWNEREETKRQRELEEQIRKRIQIRLELDAQLVANNCHREQQAAAERRFQEDQIRMWAERDRVDLMSNEKRRRKMVEYRRTVQELLEDRRRRRVEDVKQLMAEEEQQRQTERRRQEILEEERIKLLKEHATALIGFFPPGVIVISIIMDDLITLIRTEIPEGRKNLQESFSNLERVAEYCEDTYYRSDNKKASLEETKNYTTQSLASVAYQINTLAFNFLQLMDLQATQMAEMESQMNHISQTVMIHKEKVARREIGVLTANKISSRQYKIVAPLNPEKPIKYVRKPIDYTLLDDIGHGIALTNNSQKKHRVSSQGPPQATMSPNVSVGPPPTTKPPTPPQMTRSAGHSGTLGKPVSNTGTLGKASREYRTPPVVVPPQVPSHYAPNYPAGHPRRTSGSGVPGGERGPGYSTLPMPMPPSQVVMHHPPQIGMVHPMQSGPIMQHQSTFEERNSMPPPPSPLTVTHELPDHSHIGMHTLSRNMPRPGSQSPPLPPPPPPEESDHADFGRPRNTQSSLVAPIVPDDQNLPGWVPKNYIEKVVAIYDYYADKDDELSFQESSVLYVLKKNDDGWWEGVMDGVTGLFPGNYVEPCV